ncbi:hypothetical protein C0991_012518 [Blastosporella zonata]|nr:hypothetical protein C0991_012518 [Blastosporella zonata]
MATDLYETLEISRAATPEQIRKAYKKRALRTHPDRLGPGASNEDKTASEELFRKVNAAYEVLSDPHNRRAYDRYGVWPPPDPQVIPMPSTNGIHRPRSQRPHEFMNDFFADPWGHPSSFRFTDPFALFDAIFDHSSPNAHHRRHHYERPWFASELSRMMNDDFDSPHNGFGGFMSFPFFGPSLMPPQPPSFFGVGSGGQWQAESYSSSSINGVTQTSHKRRDWEGNEHVTHTYSDGRTVHTINGVEQPSTRGYIRHQPEAQTQSRHYRTHRASPSYFGNDTAGQGAVRTFVFFTLQFHKT